MQYSEQSRFLTSVRKFELQMPAVARQTMLLFPRH